MSNSINPVNPMMQQDLVDPQDYVQTGDVVRLCEIFTSAVMDDLFAQGRGQDVANAITQDDALELQFFEQMLNTMPDSNDKEVAELEMVGIAICDIFTEIAGRVELDDDKITQHIPAAMATEDTAEFLEKYEMYSLADYVRKAIP